MVASALRAFQEGAVNVKALARVIIEPPFQDIINGERRGGLDAASVRNAIY